MSDKQLMILSTLEDIKFSIELIKKRFEQVDSSDDFLADEDGLEKRKKQISINIEIDTFAYF